LLAAQQKLIELRKEIRARQEQTEPLRKAHGRNEIPPPLLHNSVKQLPKHLGWGSEPLTAAIRAAETRRSEQAEKIDFTGDSFQPPVPPINIDSSQTETREISSEEDTIRLYPDIAMAMLKQRMVASGRIWLLLRYMDKRGSGWVDIDEAREKLTRRNAPLRVCGRRQLRKLLTQGEGMFWLRQNNRIWLRSIAKTAAVLGVQRLTGLPIALSHSVLLQSIGTVRAHFYASFHSGRSSKGNHDVPRPLARERIKQLGHMSRRTQRRYEKRANIQCQSNYAITRHYSIESHQEQAWKRGRAVFLFTDYQGKLGRKEATYTAWQLPNSYKGPHDRLARGQQKRINRKLVDLSMKGMTGNGRFSDPEKRPQKPGLIRCFFTNGAQAGKNYNRFPKRDAYWLNNQYRGTDCRLYHLLPSQLDE
jgi:hypothetical protein